MRSADTRRNRRALTEDEIRRLLTAAAERPLREAMTIRHGPHKGELKAKVRDEVADQLILLGRERALIYKMLILTGLRKGELAAMRWSDLHLDGPNPLLRVRAEIAKNARSAALPIRADLVDDLKAWRATVGGEGRVFTVASGIDRIFKRDLAAANIPAKDADGRVVDVHKLRHTTASYLASAGVAPRNRPGPDATQRYPADSRNLQRPTDAGYCGGLGCPPQNGRPEACDNRLGRREEAWCSAWCFSWWNGVHRSTSGVIEWPQEQPSEAGWVNRNPLQEGHLRQQAASFDTACRKAGDGIRTHDVQLGKQEAASVIPSTTASL